MTNSEICSSFRNCANRKEQIGIIRDISLKSKKEIFDILKSNGEIKESDKDYEVLFKFCNPTKKAGKTVNKASKSNSSSSECEKNNTSDDKQEPIKRKITKKTPAGAITKRGTTKKTIQSSDSEVNISAVETHSDSNDTIDNAAASEKANQQMPVESMVNFIEFQLGCGQNIYNISSSLGVPIQQVLQMCDDHNIDVFGKPKALNLQDIKDLVGKALNYNSYIESCIESGNTKYMAEITAKQADILNQLKRTLAMAQHAEVVVQ